jgi:UPF0042 nucleotide-binding protein
LSGAGKSTALQALEDVGFFAADNVPPSLWSGLVVETERTGVTKLALGLDIRAGTTFLAEAPSALEKLGSQGSPPTVLFLDATEAALIRRFNFTRRTHPIRDGGVVEGVVAEREALEPLRSHADHTIDTTDLTAKELTRRIWGLFTAEPTFTVHLVSFGFKRGAPSDVDLMLDVRGMPNPYSGELRHRHRLHRGAAPIGRRCREAPPRPGQQVPPAGAPPRHRGRPGGAS